MLTRSFSHHRSISYALCAMHQRRPSPAAAKRFSIDRLLQCNRRSALLLAWRSSFHTNWKRRIIYFCIGFAFGGEGSESRIIIWISFGKPNLCTFSWNNISSIYLLWWWYGVVDVARILRGLVVRLAVRKMMKLALVLIYAIDGWRGDRIFGMRSVNHWKISTLNLNIWSGFWSSAKDI